MFWQLLPSVTLHVILCLIYTSIWYSPQKDFWNSYRKLAWMGFEPMTTEFRSDTLTNWAIRPWVQLALRANFVQLLQFHLSIQCSHFISAIVFGNRHICFKRNLGQAIKKKYIYIYIYIHIYIHIYIYIWGIGKSQRFAYSSPPGKILRALEPLDFPHQIFFPSPRKGNSSPH